MPPGRAKLATRPLPIGSPAGRRRSGWSMSPDLAARAGAVAHVTMTSTFSRANSAAISAARSSRPSAQRNSIVMVRPSIQPSSRSRCTKVANQWLATVGVRRPRTQWSDFTAVCCVLATSGQRRRAAEQSDECAPRRHSITSSARASSVGDRVRPSALAVFRLIRSSSLVG